MSAATPPPATPGPTNRKLGHFALNGSLPERIIVRDTSPVGSPTRLYSLILDYGWAESIACSECYRDTADSIAIIVGNHLEIPVTLAEREPSDE